MGLIKIKCTKSNTIINLLDFSGAYLFSQKSGGNYTKKGRYKNSNYVNTNVIKDILNKKEELKIKRVRVEIKGLGGVYGKNTLGPAYKEIVNFLGKRNIDARDIYNTTKIAHGGTKRKGGRRGRRT